MSGRMESNSLPEIADRIRDLIAESDAAALTSVERAMDAGRLLIEAKATCRHGEWLPFIARSGMKERRARQYMQLAQSGLKSATVADLGGIRGALEFLAKRRFPGAGESLIIFAGEDRDYFSAAYVWGSTEYPDNYYIAVLDNLEIVITPRPIDGKPIELPGEVSIVMPWEWLQRRFAAPPEEWIFESGSDAVARIVFEAAHLDAFLVESEARRNLANVHGLSLLIQQCQEVRARAA